MANVYGISLLGAWKESFPKYFRTRSLIDQYSHKNNNFVHLPHNQRLYCIESDKFCRPTAQIWRKALNSAWGGVAAALFATDRELAKTKPVLCLGSGADGAVTEDILSGRNWRRALGNGAIGSRPPPPPPPPLTPDPLILYPTARYCHTAARPPDHLIPPPPDRPNLPSPLSDQLQSENEMLYNSETWGERTNRRRRPNWRRGNDVYFESKFGVVLGWV